MLESLSGGMLPATLHRSKIIFIILILKILNIISIILIIIILVIIIIIIGRVVVPDDGEDTVAARQSLAFFVQPDDDVQ